MLPWFRRSQKIRVKVGNTSNFTRDTGFLQMGTVEVQTNIFSVKRGRLVGTWPRNNECQKTRVIPPEVPRNNWARKGGGEIVTALEARTGISNGFVLEAGLL